MDGVDCCSVMTEGPGLRFTSRFRHYKRQTPMKMHNGLEGKSALVTGGSHGIGLGCAKALARDGAQVVIMGRQEEALQHAMAEILQEFPQARIGIFCGDAGDELQVKEALAFAHGLNGSLDILVPVVGGPTFRPLLMRELDDVRQEMDVNFFTAFMLVRHGVPLLTRGGSIVCISSICTTQPGWGMTIYTAAKAALEGFVRVAALELGPAGVRINAVRPGATLAEVDASKPDAALMLKAYVAESPLGRHGMPDDIARAVRFLAGPEAGWVTGQIFSVDGGLELGKAPDFMDALFGSDVMDRVRKGIPVSVER